MKDVGKWIKNVLIGLDQLLNAVGCGDPDETISSRIGKIKMMNGGDIPWRMFVVKLIDWILEKIELGHTINAIEEDEGKDEIK